MYQPESSLKLKMANFVTYVLVKNIGFIRLHKIMKLLPMGTIHFQIFQIQNHLRIEIQELGVNICPTASSAEILQLSACFTIW